MKRGTYSHIMKVRGELNSGEKKRSSGEKKRK